jgi:Tfp pilus assembly protein FimT
MNKGFTLFEAVISLTILSAIIYLASTSFLNLVPKYRLEKAVWEIRSALNSVRYKALVEGTSFRVKLYSDSYSVEKYEESTKIWMLAEKHILEGVAVETNNAPIFTPEGTVSGLATIYVSNARGTYKITLAITGRIKAVKI